MVGSGRNVEPHAQTIGRAYKNISRGMAVLHTAIAVMTSGVTQAVLQAFAPADELVGVVTLTAPLTVASAIVAGLIISGRFSRMQTMERVFAVAAAVLVPYFIAEYFGLVATSPGRQAGDGLISYLNPVRAIEGVAALLEHYLSVFGAVTALSAIACGIFLAWAIVTQLLPALKPRPAPPA